MLVIFLLVGMVLVSYHASHEQFAPSRLLDLVRRAEDAGFHAAKCSDHFHPWSERQGQSGFAWSWLGAALQATHFTIGSITAPGYRYHPAIVAQGAATLAELFEGRFWLALGSGEAINESITGEAWPEKDERNERLLECVAIIRALLSGERVTHRGRVKTIEAKLYSLPKKQVPLFGAAMSERTAALAGRWADGILLAGHDPKAVAPLIRAFESTGGESKPVHIQMAVSWAETLEQANKDAIDQWAASSIGGEAAWDLRRPSDFDHASRFIRAEDLASSILITDSLRELEDSLGALERIGAHTVHLHMVGLDQEGFIDQVSASGLLQPIARGTASAHASLREQEVPS